MHYILYNERYSTWSMIKTRQNECVMFFLYCILEFMYMHIILETTDFRIILFSGYILFFLSNIISYYIL